MRHTSNTMAVSREVSGKIGFTCGDILLIPDFKDAVVLAGASGMQRAIHRVNVMEVPDVIDWVRPGEFLITSGFPFRDNPEVLSAMIPQLAEKGVAALGIKTKRFIDHIPEEALELAEQLGFPIFELPPSTVFSDVVRDIMERVLVQEARELSLLQSRFQKLSQQLLYGKGLEEFLQTLDEMLGNPVVLLDDADHLILSPQAERLSADPAVWSELREYSNLGVSFMTIGGRRIRVYISAVNGNHHQRCLLMLLEWDQEHTVVDQLTIDRVGVLVGLEMINAHARKEVESKYVDQFLQDWLTGRIVTAEDLLIRGEACGCPMPEGRRLYAGLVRWLDGKPQTRMLQSSMRRLRARMAPYIQVTLLEGELALLLSVPPEGDPEAMLSLALSELGDIFGTESCSICLGNAVLLPNQLHLSCQDARKIHAISVICDFREPIIDHRRLGVFELLYLLPDNEEVRGYADRYIAPLLAYDAKHKTALLETVKLYYRYNRNVKKTSQELFTHYNTVTYRIERACEILGLRQDEGDDLLQLQLALKLHEMRPVQTDKERMGHR